MMVKVTYIHVIQRYWRLLGNSASIPKFYIYKPRLKGHCVCGAGGFICRSSETWLLVAM